MHAFDTPCGLAFGFPELQESVFRFGGLSSIDLVNAACVNRTWFHIVSPYIWESVDVRDIHGHHREGLQAGLYTHGQWIERLKCQDIQIFGWLSENEKCCGLLTVDFALRPLDALTTIKYLNTIVARNHELKLLQCCCNGSRVNAKESDIIKGLMNFDQGCLTDLKITWWQTEDDWSKVLNHHSNTLQRLEFSDCFLSSSMFKTLQPLIKVQTLIFDDNQNGRPDSGHLASNFVKLVNSTPNLSELILVTEVQTLIQNLVSVLKSGSLPLLEALNVEVRSDVLQRDHKAANFLTNIPRSIKRLSLQGLELFTLANSALMNLAIENQLVSIDMISCGKIQSETWQTILTNCSSLIKLRSDKHSRIYVAAMNNPWACTGLKIFEMAVVVGKRSLEELVDVDEIPDDEVEGEEMWCMKVLKEVEKVRMEERQLVSVDCQKLFSQLAALTQLTKLRMHIQSPNSTRESWPPITQDTDEFLPTSFGCEHEEFSEKWTLLKSCVKLEMVQVQFLIMDQMANETDLYEKSREMWGSGITVDLNWDGYF